MLLPRAAHPPVSRLSLLLVARLAPDNRFAKICDIAGGNTWPPDSHSRQEAYKPREHQGAVVLDGADFYAVMEFEAFAALSEQLPREHCL